MSTWERTFEFGDRSLIRGITAVDDGLILSGLFTNNKPDGHFTTKQGAPTPWAPVEGFICKVPFSGSDFTWFTPLKRFDLTGHAFSDCRIFLTGTGLKPATVDTPECEWGAVLEVDAINGCAYGEKTFIEDPTESKVKWSLGWPVYPIASANLCFAAGLAYGSPFAKYMGDWQVRLPYLATVKQPELAHAATAAPLSVSVTVLGEREHYRYRYPQALHLTRDGTLLMLVSKSQGGADPTEHFVLRLGHGMHMQFLPVISWEKQLQGVSSVASVCEADDGGIVIAGAIKRS